MDWYDFNLSRLRAQSRRLRDGLQLNTYLFVLATKRTLR